MPATRGLRRNAKSFGTSFHGRFIVSAPPFLVRAVMAGTVAFLGMRVVACGGAVDPAGPRGTGARGASGTVAVATGAPSACTGSCGERPRAPVEFDKVVGEP
jgi:hypothetical protein